MDNIYDSTPELPYYHPINLVSFKLMHDGKEIHTIQYNKESMYSLTINCIVYLSNDYVNSFQTFDYYAVYLMARSKHDRIAFQKIDLPVKQMADTHQQLLNLSFSFEIPANLSYFGELYLQLSAGPKRLDEMGIGETMRGGTFLTTEIPVEVLNEK